MKLAYLALATLALAPACKEKNQTASPAPAASTVSAVQAVEEPAPAQERDPVIVSVAANCYQWLDNLTQTVVPGKSFADVYNEKGASLFVAMVTPVVDQLDRLNVLAAKDAASLKEKLGALERDSSTNKNIRTAVILGLNVLKCDFLPTNGATYDLLAGVLQASYTLSGSRN